MGKPFQPLPEFLRPQTLAEVVGQDHLLGAGGFLTQSIASGRPASIILWGPAGTGKTTIARLYANAFGAQFEQLSAVFSGVVDVRKVVQKAQDNRQKSQINLLDSAPITVLFVDEIHRFNKAQQDAFLPYVEDGTLILIGATTENPSFSLNDALLSRAQVLTLHPLGEGALNQLLERAEKACGPLPLQAEAKNLLVRYAHGDGRYLLTMAAAVYSAAPNAPFAAEALGQFLQKRAPMFDKNGDGHYNLISALHKAVRGSDPDAALYWLNRMLAGGEDPLYIARRLIRMAAEDIGLAAPQALPHCVAALQAYQALGTPEGELALAQAAVFLAVLPKSNSVYKGFKAARKSAEETHHLPPPAHSLNAPTKLMAHLGYGVGYSYDHDAPEGFSGQNYFPEKMPRQKFYTPTPYGHEKNIALTLERLEALRTEIIKQEKTKNG